MLLAPLYEEFYTQVYVKKEEGTIPWIGEVWCCDLEPHQRTHPLLLLLLTSKGIPKACSSNYLKDLMGFYC